MVISTLLGLYFLYIIANLGFLDVSISVSSVKRYKDDIDWKIFPDERLLQRDWKICLKKPVNQGVDSK